MAARCPTSLVLLAALVLPVFLPLGQASALQPLVEIYRAPDPMVNADLNVTVIWAGVNVSASEEAALRARVLPSFEPVVGASNETLGVNFTVRLTFRTATPAFLSEFGAALNASFANDTLGRVVANYIGLRANLSTAFPGYDDLTPVPHADADEMTAFLAAAGARHREFAVPDGTPRLLFLNPYLVHEPYYYAVKTLDHDRGTNLTYETLNAWGDASGVYFQDLRACPSKLGEDATAGRAANFAGMPPIWSYGPSASERARLLTDLATYINASLLALLAPSFIVTPFAPSSLTYNVTLLDATSQQTLFRPGGAGSSFAINTASDILNPALVGSALRALLPIAPVQVNLHTANSSTDPGIAAAVSAHATPDAVSGAGILEPFGTATDLNGLWGSVPNNPVRPGEAVSVPVLLVVFSSDAWVQSTFTRGVTLQRSDGRAAGILIASGLAQLSQRGFTETLIHEGGHAIGLGHPHELFWRAPNGSLQTEVDWLRSASSSPMTYLPIYADYSFDAFDRGSLWYAIAAATLKAAYETRENAFDLLDIRRYDPSNLLSSVLENESLFEERASETLAALAAGPRFVGPVSPSSSSSPIALAKRAYDAAASLEAAARAAPVCCGPATPKWLPGLEAPAALAAAAVFVAFVAVKSRRREP